MTLLIFVEVVVRVNQELLKSLKEFFRHNGLLNDGQQPEDSTKNLSLGDIFLKMTPYLKSYTSYAFLTQLTEIVISTSTSQHSRS